MEPVSGTCAKLPMSCVYPKPREEDDLDVSECLSWFSPPDDDVFQEELALSAEWSLLSSSGDENINTPLASPDIPYNDFHTLEDSDLGSYGSDLGFHLGLESASWSSVDCGQETSMGALSCWNHGFLQEGWTNSTNCSSSVAEELSAYMFDPVDFQNSLKIPETTHGDQNQLVDDDYDGYIWIDTNLRPGRPCALGASSIHKSPRASPILTSDRSSSRVQKRKRRKETLKNCCSSRTEKYLEDSLHMKGDGENDDGEEETSANGHESRKLACPFYKHDRVIHLSCAHFQMKRVKDVKQHLLRKHSFHCPTCYEVFPDNKKCEDHIADNNCQKADMKSRNTEALSYSISVEQKKMFSKRLNGGSNGEEHSWYSIWSVLFPGAALPGSPFLKSGVEEVILTVQELWRRNGSEVLSSLESHGTDPMNGNGVLPVVPENEWTLVPRSGQATGTGDDKVLGLLERLANISAGRADEEAADSATGGRWEDVTSACPWLSQANAISQSFSSLSPSFNMSP